MEWSGEHDVAGWRRVADGWQMRSPDLAHMLRLAIDGHEDDTVIRMSLVPAPGGWTVRRDRVRPRRAMRFSA